MLTALQSYVVENPLRSLLFVVIAIVLIILAIKRAIADDVSEAHSHLKKSNRLD